MSNWPFLGGFTELLTTSQGGSSLGANFTCGANDAKASWTELNASLTRDYAGFVLQIGDMGTANQTYLIDIAIGGAGSEKILVENVYVDASGTFYAGDNFDFPIVLPKGARLAIRGQTSNGSNVTVRAQIHGITAAWPDMPGFSKMETIGADTANSKGTSVDPGATANTEGAWTQIIASTTDDIAGLMLNLGSDGTIVSGRLLIDIAIGASLSEQIVVEDYTFAQSAGAERTFRNVAFFPIEIPAGTRIAIRAQSDTNTTPGREFDVVLHGLVR